MIVSEVLREASRQVVDSRTGRGCCEGCGRMHACGSGIVARRRM